MDSAWQLYVASSRAAASGSMPPPPPPRRVPRFFEGVDEDWWTREQEFEGFVFDVPPPSQGCFACFWSVHMRAVAGGFLECPRCRCRHGVRAGCSPRVTRAVEGVSGWWHLVSRDSVCDMVIGLMSACAAAGAWSPEATHAAVCTLQLARVFLAGRGPSLRLERVRRAWDLARARLDAGDVAWFANGAVLRACRAEMSSP